MCILIDLLKPEGWNLVTGYFGDIDPPFGDTDPPKLVVL
jgi:hypothetical protein